ncbi:MAG: peptidase caspase catalytic subunit p20 [Myxococcaceae bacterium]|nr:peptidase caspase catalytic subunit p20 [Myxococcaceae bacterium]
MSPGPRERSRAARHLLALLLLALPAQGQDGWAPLPAPAPAAASGPIRRFALVAGNDEGGSGTRELLYARDDARKLHAILMRVGGVREADSMLLLNADADDLLTALGELERQAKDARAQGDRTSLFFYYSGHAKDGALRLGKSKLPMESLKARLAQSPADMRVAVFDACHSGTMTRTKGVRRAPAFEVESDATRAAKGLVILTSSASDEDSQESDAIGGSYFSHHLASGLLGDADRSGDGKVSLGEAYAYAYERTVADTVESAAGAQHPTFSFDLAGNGDLVLTDFAERKEGLRFPASSPAGTYFLVDPKGFVVAELSKVLGVERLVALAPGRYFVKRRLPDRLRVGEVSVSAGQLAVLEESDLKDVAFADDPVKGVERNLVYGRHWSIGASGSYQYVFDAPLSRGGYFPSSPVIGIDTTFHNAFGKGFGVGIDGVYGFANGTLNTGVFSTPYRYSLLSVGSTVLYEWPDGRWVPYLGVRLGLNIMGREFPGTGLPAQNYQTFSPGAVAGIKLRLSKRFSISVRGRLHYLLYNVDQVRNFGYLELASVLNYEFRD